MSLWTRIKEHKVAQWTLAYVAFAFALLHGATLMSDALEWPHAIVRALTLVLVIRDGARTTLIHRLSPPC
jgi:hypothetical protein